MLEYNFVFRKVRQLIWLVLTISILLGYSWQNVAGSVYYPLSLQPYTTVTTPPVILQAGTAGTSTIYTNNTSAKVNVVAPVSTYDFVDNNISDVDSSADKGAHSNFTAQQYGPDSVYDTLTEADTDGAGGSEWLDCDAYDSTYTTFDNFIGDSPYLGIADYPTNYIHEVKSAGAQAGWFNFSDTTLTGSISVNISIYCRNDDGVGNDRIDVYVDYTGAGSGADVGDAAQHTDWQYDVIDLGSHTVSEVNNLRVYFEVVNVGGGDDIYVDHGRIGVSASAETNYELDLEVQWTTADYDETDEYLCIYAGAMDTEDLKVDVRNTTASYWDNLFTNLTANSWNNISISDYLTSATFIIRFKGNTETGDPSQDSWNIDATLLHVWTDQSYDYVLEVNNTVAQNWNIRLKAYDQTNIDRLKNCTIYFYNGGNSRQIYILNGAYDQQVGNWYSLAASDSDYIAITLSATNTGTSYVYVYLEILVPTTSTYARYIITFEIA